MDGHRLFIDDIRWGPSTKWTVIRNSRTALITIDGLRRIGNHIESISFDHDLGGDDTTRPVVLYLCEHDYWPTNVFVHSQNNVGVEWLSGMVDRYAPSGTLKRIPGGRWTEHHCTAPKE